MAADPQGDVENRRAPDGGNHAPDSAGTEPMTRLF
jgi:hypothetical protein